MASDRLLRHQGRQVEEQLSEVMEKRFADKA